MMLPLGQSPVSPRFKRRLRLLALLHRDRPLAIVALLTFVWGTTLLPLVHNIEHRDDHQHGVLGSHEHSSPHDQLGASASDHHRVEHDDVIELVPFDQIEHRIGVAGLSDNTSLTRSRANLPPLLPVGSDHHAHGSGSLAHLGVALVTDRAPTLIEPCRIAELLPESPARAFRLSAQYWTSPPARAPPVS